MLEEYCYSEKPKVSRGIDMVIEPKRERHFGQKKNSKESNSLDQNAEAYGLDDWSRGLMASLM